MSADAPEVFEFKDAKDVFLGHKSLVAGMALVGQDVLYTAGQDGRLIAYNCHDREKLDEARAKDAISALAFDGSELYAASGRSVQLVRRGRGALAPLTAQHEHSVTALAAAPGALVVGYSDGALRWYSGADLMKQWRPHRGAIGGLHVTAKRVYSAAADGSASVLTRDTGQAASLVEASRRPLRCIIETHGLVAIAAGPHVHVHKKDGSHKATMKHHTADIHAFLGDREQLFSGAGDRRVVVWSMTKLAPLLVIVTGHSNRVKCLELRPAHGLLYTGSGDKTVRVFDLKEAFNQRAEWGKQHKAKKKFGLFGSKQRKVSDTRPAPAQGAAVPKDTSVKTLEVTSEDINMLAGWEAQMAQQAEIDKQKDAQWKAQHLSGSGSKPSSRRGTSTSSASASNSATSTPTTQHRAVSSAAAPAASAQPPKPPRTSRGASPHHAPSPVTPAALQAKQAAAAGSSSPPVHHRAASSNMPPFGGAPAAGGAQDGYAPLPIEVTDDDEFNNFNPYGNVGELQAIVEAQNRAAMQPPRF